MLNKKAIGFKSNFCLAPLGARQKLQNKTENNKKKK